MQAQQSALGALQKRKHALCGAELSVARSQERSSVQRTARRTGSEVFGKSERFRRFEQTRACPFFRSFRRTLHVPGRRRGPLFGQGGRLALRRRTCGLPVRPRRDRLMAAFVEVTDPADLGDTARGAGGHGSTGR